MDITKEVIETIIGLKNEEVLEINGMSFKKDGYNYVKPLKTGTPDIFNIKTLAGFVDFVNDFTVENEEFTINVNSPRVVRLYGKLDTEFGIRFKYADSIFRFQIPEIERWRAPEDFNIFLQSNFAETEVRDSIIEVTGNIKIENSETFKETGLSQTVNTVDGHVPGKTEIINPVYLKPFLSFSEIDQPVIPYILRINKQGECCLFEAGGEQWMIEAVENIVNYIKENLKNKDIIIIR